MKKKVLAFVLCLAMVLTLIPTMSSTAAGVETSGACGDDTYGTAYDLKWFFKDGTLTISGEGPMANYRYEDEAPWYDLRDDITKVTISGTNSEEDRFATIGDYAFSRVYPKLSTVEIGKNVSSIGAHSFDDCGALNNLTLTEGVRGIGACAFKYCSSLSEVTIPKSIWDIGISAFAGCTALRSVTILPIPENEAEISRGAFAGCNSLETVILGGNVSLWASNIFGDCPALKTVIIENVNELSDCIFGDSPLNSLSLIFVADPPESIDIDVFDGVTANAYYPGDNSRWTEEVRQNYGGELNWIPIIALGTCGKTEADKVNWLLLNDGIMLIYGIGEMTDWSDATDTPWYSRRNEIKKLSICGNIKNIGKNAFSDCSKLEEVSTLPNSLKTIGFKSFRKCTALKSFDIPDSVTKLDAEVFYGCTFLESVTGNKNVTKINYNTFNSCKKLKNAPIGNNVTSIGDNAFNGCTSLTSVTFPNSLKSLSYNAFIGCTELKKITIPASVTSIGKTAFRNCSAMQSVTMEGSVETIGENAFEGCGMLNVVRFYGDMPPTIDSVAFTDVTATVFYPIGKEKWTAEGIQQNYGGNLTWVAHEHIAIMNKAEAATCTEDGWKAYYECPTCGALYCDEAMTAEITDFVAWKFGDGKLEKTGHTWENATCTKPKTCTVCGTTEGEALGHTFENGVCTECGFAQFKFNSASLVLSGELVMDINCTVNDTEAVKDGYMEMTVGSTSTQKVSLSDAVHNADGTYSFPCYLNVLQMADDITLSFHYGDTVVGPYAKSVAQYLNNIKSKYGDNAELVALAEAIADYGHFAQPALQDVHGFTLGEDGKYQTMNRISEEAFVLPEADDLASYKATKTGSIAQITNVSRALALDHGTDILLYLTCTGGYTPDITVTDKDGTSVAYTLSPNASGKFTLTIPQISAHKLGDFYKVRIDNGAMEIKISALSYAYSVLKSATASDAQKEAVAALYYYYQAAIAYQAAKN